GQRGDERLEGSRFGSHPRDLALFFSVRVWPQIFLNRWLPRTTQRVVCLLVYLLSAICYSRGATSAPPQELPAPAVHPKQWLPNKMACPSSWSGSRSQTKSGFSFRHCIPSC